MPRDYSKPRSISDRERESRNKNRNRMIMMDKLSCTNFIKNDPTGLFSDQSKACAIRLQESILNDIRKAGL